jgi:hypothetical protein
MDVKLDLPDVELDELVVYARSCAEAELRRQMEIEELKAEQHEKEEIVMLTAVMEWLPRSIRQYMTILDSRPDSEQRYDRIADLNVPGLAPVRFYIRKVTEWTPEEHDHVVTGAVLANRNALSVLRYQPRRWEEGWYLSYEEEFIDDLALALAKAAEIGDIKAEQEMEVRQRQDGWEEEQGRMDKGGGVDIFDPATLLNGAHFQLDDQQGIRMALIAIGMILNGISKSMEARQWY